VDRMRAFSRSSMLSQRHQIGRFESLIEWHWDCMEAGPGSSFCYTRIGDAGTTTRWFDTEARARDYWRGLRV